MRHSDEIQFKKASGLIRSEKKCGKNKNKKTKKRSFFAPINQSVKSEWESERERALENS